MTILQFGDVALLGSYLVCKFLLGKACQTALLSQSLCQAEGQMFMEKDKQKDAQTLRRLRR